MSRRPVGGGPLVTFRVHSRDDERRIRRDAKAAGLDKSSWIRRRLGLQELIGRARKKTVPVVLGG
jgi:hypothetical protein